MKKAGIVVLLLTTINVTPEWLLIFLDLQLEGGGVEEAKDVKQQTTPVKEKHLFPLLVTSYQFYKTNFDDKYSFSSVVFITPSILKYV